MIEEQSNEEEKRLELEGVLLPLRAHPTTETKFITSSHRGPNTFEKPERIHERKASLLHCDARCLKMSKSGKTSRLGEVPAEVSTAGRMEQPPPGCCRRRRDAAAAASALLRHAEKELELHPAKRVKSTHGHPFWDKPAADTGSFFILASYALLKFKKRSLA